MDWLVSIIVAVLGGIFGTGGIAAIIKARRDKNSGIKQDQIALDTAETDNWQKLLREYKETLYDPLKARVEGLETTVKGLNTQVTALTKEKRAWEKREILYWRWTTDLIDHINDGKGPPAPPAPEGLNDL